MDRDRDIDTLTSFAAGFARFVMYGVGGFFVAMFVAVAFAILTAIGIRTFGGNPNDYFGMVNVGGAILFFIIWLRIAIAGMRG